jgi:hypothetical protein
MLANIDHKKTTNNDPALYCYTVAEGGVAGQAFGKLWHWDSAYMEH